MRVKDITLASILVAFLIAQNYLFYALPFTLTYVTLYLISKKIKSIRITYLSVFAFVLVKNIIYTALPTTIIFDLIGLLIFTTLSKINNKIISYPLIFLSVIFHLLLLDLSTAILTNEIFKAMIIKLSTGFLVYIYGPISTFLIVVIDGVEFITEYEN